MIRRLKNWFEKWFGNGPETWVPELPQGSIGPIPLWPTAHLIGGTGDGETITVPPILNITSKYIAFDRMEHGETHRYASTGQHQECGCLALIHLGRIE